MKRCVIATCTAVFAIGMGCSESQSGKARSGVQVEVKEGNVSCSDLPGSYIEYKIDPVTAGLHSDGRLDVTLSDLLEKRFDFATNIGVDYVLVKGGPNTNVYRYTSEATSGDNLTAPGGDYGLSHITFCYDIETDAGQETSVETGTDTGTDNDTGMVTDTGTDNDTGMVTDTGVVTDTGTPPMDTGTPPVDTGCNIEEDPECL